MVISKISLAIICCQAIFFLYCGVFHEKFNQRIDTVIAAVEQTPVDSFLLPIKRDITQKLNTVQRLNREHNAVLKGIIILGLLQTAIAYSLYIHFLRMGYSWTKVALHLNNLGTGVLLGSWGMLWVILYVVATRILKHYYVSREFSEEGHCP